MSGLYALICKGFTAMHVDLALESASKMFEAVTKKEYTTLKTNTSKIIKNSYPIKNIK